MRRLVALAGLGVLAVVAALVMSRLVGDREGVRQLTVTPAGFNSAIEAEARRAAGPLTRGLVADRSQPELVGLTQPRRQYVVAALRYPPASGTGAVYAVVLLRNSTEGYRMIDGVAACDRTGRGAALALPLPGPDVVVVMDAAEPTKVPFGSRIAAPAGLGLQAWLDPRRRSDDVAVSIIGQPVDAPSCERPDASP